MSQRFCHILVVSAIFGACITWLSITQCHLKAIQMKIQCSHIRKLVLYEFKLGPSVKGATKNTCVKFNSTVDQSTVTTWLKKFRLSCKNVNDRARLGRLKTGEFGNLIQVLEANPVYSTQKVSGSASFSPVYFIIFMTSVKNTYLILLSVNQGGIKYHF